MGEHGARGPSDPAAAPGAEILVNGEPRALPRDRTLASLLSSLSLRAEWVLVERNGEAVPREQYDSVVLAPGDRLELATPMAGG